MGKQLNISIGIPAYNEEKNILQLLADINKQEMKNTVISEIIISSDGSTDNSVSLINGIRNNKILIFENKKREGVARGLNQIINKAKGDILVILDADIRLLDKNFINKLIKPIVAGNADLTSSDIQPLSTKNYFSKVLDVSMKYKHILFENIYSGNNSYTCFGLARGFSKNLYKKMHFPISIGNDMYSYLFCRKNKILFNYVKEAKARYSLPNNFSDHQKQSIRFSSNKTLLNDYFDNLLLESELKISIFTILKSLPKAIKLFTEYPLETVSYLLLQLKVKFSNTPVVMNKQTWDIATSSKKLNIL